MTQLVSYRSSVVTPDTAEALRLLEVEAHKQKGLKVKYRGVSSSHASWAGVGQDQGPTGLPPELSLRPSGREVYLSLEHDTNTSRVDLLGVLWSIVVPLGFIPWSRFPVPNVYDMVFHYPGPWTPLVDSLHGEGLGEKVWPSFASAAQCEVGKWEGDRLVERSIQAHLHRLGVHCGPIEGKIEERTLASLKALGIGGLPLSQVLQAIEKMHLPEGGRREEEPQLGHFTMKGRRVEAFSSGSARSSKTRTGYSVEATGPGRLILLFGESQ